MKKRIENLEQAVLVLYFIWLFSIVFLIVKASL